MHSYESFNRARTPCHTLQTSMQRTRSVFYLIKIHSKSMANPELFFSACARNSLSQSFQLVFLSEAHTKWTKNMSKTINSCNNHLDYSSGSQFQSSRTPTLQSFSYHFRCLLGPAKWTSQDFPPWFQLESNCICSIQRALKCKRHEFKLHLFTDVHYVTFHAYLVSFVCVWRRCRLSRSAYPWMNVPKWSKIQPISLLRE